MGFPWKWRRGASTPASSLAELKPASRSQRLLRTANTYIIVVGVCALLDLRGFNYFEQYAQYLRQGIHERRNVSLAELARQQIVLVPISDATVRELGGPPIPRGHHAKVVRELTKAGAKVIGFDLIFDQPSPQDGPFIEAARELKRVLWATLFEKQETPDQRQVEVIPSLLKASPFEGHISIVQKEDVMTVDTFEPIVIDQNRLIPSFSLEAALMELNLTHKPILKTDTSWEIGDLSVPIDFEGHLKISYQGQPEQVFPTVPYEDVYNGVADDAFYVKNKFFNNKIVLIGDITTVGNDHRFTPLGDMDGLEIHAHAISTILQRGFINEIPEWGNLAVICLMAALVAPIASLLRLQSAIACSFLLAVGYFAVNLWLFSDYRILLHLVGPGTAIVLMALTVMTERSLLEEREKNRVQGLLRRYVSPQVAAYVIDNPDKCFLGTGEQVTATVLFSDIRGFTALSEEMNPQQLVTHLNEYFQAMTDVIFKHEGTVDKFMGDAVMAIFGAPVPHPDDERRAVAAAIDMQLALDELQIHWCKQGLPTFKMGVGIHTGSMVIGNIGASERLDFTAIGDTVNLACRIEELSKHHQCGILITEATYQAVQDLVEARGPIESSIRGRKEQVVVYEILGWRGQSSVAEEKENLATAKI